jgi:hypothetical protein
MSEVVRYVSRQYNVPYNIEADKGIDEFVLHRANRPESCIENEKITFYHFTDACASTVAPVTVG